MNLKFNYSVKFSSIEGHHQVFRKPYSHNLTSFRRTASVGVIPLKVSLWIALFLPILVQDQKPLGNIRDGGSMIKSIFFFIQTATVVNILIHNKKDLSVIYKCDNTFLFVKLLKELKNTQHLSQIGGKIREAFAKQQI